MKKFWEPYKGLPKGIYIIFLARIINSMGNFVQPFLTLFLTDKLGLSNLQTGRFVMAWAIFYGAGSIIGGKLCDRVGRKKVMLIFQFLSAACYIPCAFSVYSNLIPYLLILSGFFGGAADPSHMAMVTDVTEVKNRKEAFSLLYLGNNIGFAVGPMIAGLLYRKHLPLLFIGDAFTTFISLILINGYIKETKPDQKAIEDSRKMKKNSEKAEEGGLFSALCKRPALLVFAAIMIIYSFIYTQYKFSLPIQMNETFKVDGPRLYGILMTINGLTVVFLTPRIISLTIKFKPIMGLFLGGMLYAAGFGMVYFICSMPLFMVSTVIWTAGEVLVTTNASVYAANSTPISHRGRFGSVLPLIMGMGAAFGPYLTGSFMDHVSIKAVWILIFCLSVIASFAMLCLKHYEERSLQKANWGSIDVDGK